MLPGSKNQTLESKLKEIKKNRYLRKKLENNLRNEKEIKKDKRK